MRSLTRFLPALAALALAGCAGFATAPTGASDSLRTLATPLADGHTAEGSFIDGFAYSEKPGDARLVKVAVGAGVTHAIGEIDPKRGSTWGGIGVTTGVARGTRSVDIATAHTLVLALAANGTGTLRVRLVGTDTAVRDAGCYPIALVRVTPELRDYTLPVASFAPESYCAAGSPGGVAAASALTAVEVADAAVVPGRRRQVDFSVGAIRVAP